jgi:hypothetical protein
MSNLQEGMDMTTVSTSSIFRRVLLLTRSVVYGSLHVRIQIQPQSSHTNLTQGCPQLLHVTKGCQ